MRAYDIILKKRTGAELTRDEIEFLIEGYMTETVPDYQMSAWAMAVYFKGMNARETSDLTMAIVNSGEQVDLSAISGSKVDKHSTGGVGDKTTLVLAPLVAAAGVPVAKMSGRGLGHTGGTIDKLEAIPGFNTSLTNEEFISSVNRVKMALSGQTGNLAPADKKLYALRDVTATVDSIPLIASSVMSKKIASGADAIVLDVKTGSGAFMKTLDDSIELARAMVAIGSQVGRRTVAVLTDMDQPLGLTVGNAVEVQEAIACLHGRGPKDLSELCLFLGSQMVHMAGLAESADRARPYLQKILDEGSALEKFREFIRNQGGDDACVDDPEVLVSGVQALDVVASDNGYVQRIRAEAIGLAAMRLGAGRAAKNDVIDLAVGIRLKKKVGDPVEKGEVLAELLAKHPEKAGDIRSQVRDAFVIAPQPVVPPKLILGLVNQEGVTIF